MAISQDTALQMGQMGSVFLDASGAASPPNNKVFVAITFLEDTVFDSGTTGLVAETTQLFPDSTGTGTLIDADGGDVVDSETFPKGITIYGRWTGFKLASGRVIAYLGV